MPRCLIHQLHSMFDIDNAVQVHNKLHMASYDDDWEPDGQYDILKWEVINLSALHNYTQVYISERMNSEWCASVKVFDVAFK